MKRLILSLLALPLVVAALPAAQAGPTQGGIASDNVEYVTFVPFEPGTATGVTIVGKYMYLTSWKNLSIYDISNPESPQLITGSYRPLGFQFENEKVATNGKILLFSETVPRGDLHVWDVEDKSNPVEVATVTGGGDHTSTCLLNCRWAYGSEGTITDLKNPAAPVLHDENWIQLLGLNGDMHWVEEIKPGFIVTSPTSTPVPVQLIDARNPLKPKILASGDWPDEANIVHSTDWPRSGNDRFLLAQAEQNAQTRCAQTGGFMVFDTTGWKKTRTFKLTDYMELQNGTAVDGNPPANGLGCSMHWFEAHPSFHNGGLVAAGAYEHGTRFLNITSAGKVEQVGHFMPYGGSTSQAEWVTKDLVYAVDYTRGIDVLRFNDK